MPDSSPRFSLPVAGDTETAIQVVDHALTRMMEATRVDFARWEAVGEFMFGNEFSVDEPELLPPELRLATLLAQLCRSAAMFWGLETRGGGLGRVVMDDTAAATPLRLALGHGEVA